MIIFEGKEIIVHHHKGNSNYIIISFEGANECDKASSNFFLKPIMEKYNISCLGITSKTNDYYYIHPEIQKVINICNKISRGYKKIIITGLSMGGYAALKYSKSLNANSVFAMAPQCTINKNICPVYEQIEAVASEFTKEEVEDSTIQAKDLQGEIYLVYDPFSPSDTFDKEHIGFLYRIIPQAITVPTFFSGHPVISHIKGSEVFKAIIDALIEGNNQKVIHTVSYIRRHHITNIITKTWHAIIKHPLLVYKMLTSPTFAQVKNNNQLFQDYNLRLRLCYILNINGYQNESSKYLLSIFLYNTQKIDSNVDSNQLLSPINPYPFIISVQGCYICYNFITKKLSTIHNIGEKAHCLPLQLYKINGKIKLICLHNNCIFELQYTEDPLLFNLALLTNHHTKNNIKLNFNGYHTYIRTNDNRYIGVDLNKAIFTAVVPQEWECFTSISMVSPTEITTPNTIF